MNIQFSTMPESVPASGAAPVPAAQLVYWSVRRELWEYRSIYIAPLAVAVLFLFGFMISMFHLPAKILAASTLSPVQQQAAIEQPYDFASLLIMAVALVVAVFYCLDALHGERRDRSILFWKSLPVSDLITVLSKASIPLVVLPLVAFAVTAAVQLLMLVSSTVVLAGSGVGPGLLWANFPLAERWIMLFFHLLAGHGFYYAPFYGWLLLVSGWARRAPFLWASLPMLAIAMVEKVAFNTSYFGTMLRVRLIGASGTGPMGSDNALMHRLTPSMLGNFLISPGLWIGLAIFAAFLAAAVRLRRYQGPV